MRGVIRSSSRVRQVVVIATVVAATLPLLAVAQASDAAMQARFCAGLSIEITLPDDTRADCISNTHAIEVEFSKYWATALGQVLHYSLWTEEIAAAPADFAPWSRLIDSPRKAGIILVCRKAQDTCTGHYVRLFRIIEHFRLQVTIWDCDERDDPTLADCQVIDMPK
jgi:hypothetical protein